MTESWTISPLIGVGPLKLGMSRAAVDALSESLGPIDEPVSEETRPDGGRCWSSIGTRTRRNVCSTVTRYARSSCPSSCASDIQLDSTSIFTAPPQDALAALVRA